jgi:hypothetical protein
VVARLALYKQTEMLRRRIQDLNDPVAQESLNKELDDLWAGLDTGSVTLQSFQDAITDIAKKVDTLLKQQEVMAAAPPNIDHETASKITDLMTESRRGLIQPGIQPDSLRHFDAAMDLYRGALKLSQLKDSNRTQMQHQRLREWRSLVERKVATGFDTFRETAFLYNYVRPLFYFLIVFAVGLTGAFSQYASDAHSTFGASYLDYLSIALWGFGSQVVAATFGDLQSLK